MTSWISHLSFDCHDAYSLSEFWAEVLGMAADPRDLNEPGHGESMILSADGRTRLLFIEVPDEKVAKNRLHLDLAPEDRTRDEEATRLAGLGATQVADRRTSAGGGWVT